MQKFVEMIFFEVLFVGIVFVSSIIPSHIITESSIILSTYLPFSQLHVAGFQMHKFFLFFAIYSCYMFLLILPITTTFIVVPFFTIKLTFAFAWYMFCYFLDSFFLVIVLKTYKFKSFVSFGAHTLLHRSSRVLKLPVPISRLTANG